MIWIFYDKKCFLQMNSSYQSSVSTETSYHISSYDDTTLTPGNSAILMAYYRFIDSTGTVILQRLKASLLFK
jgi:hypothetical protein